MCNIIHPLIDIVCYLTLINFVDLNWMCNSYFLCLIYSRQHGPSMTTNTQVGTKLGCINFELNCIPTIIRFGKKNFN